MAILASDLPTLDEVGDIDRFIVSYRRHLAAEGRGVSTRRNFPRRVEIFRDFLKERGMPTNVHSITREHIETYIASLLDAFPGGVATTQSPRTYYYHLASFFSFLTDVYEEIAVSPMANMKPPKVAERVVGIIEASVVSALLKTCSVRGGDMTKNQKFLNLRDEALIRLGVDAGPRLAELTDLDKHIDLSRRCARVLGKGMFERDIVFGAKSARALDKYLISRERHPHADLDALWIGRGGKLTASGISLMLTKRSALIGTHITPHQLRHTWAHSLKLSGMRDEELMVLGGWRDPTMMRHYGKSAAVERAAATHAQMSPGDRF